jgi:hypothetical protein
VETIERGKKQKGEEGKKLIDGRREDKKRGWRRIALRRRERLKERGLRGYKEIEKETNGNETMSDGEEHKNRVIERIT